MSLISAITARGHMRFMIKEKGGVNADVFIEFLKRLISGVERTIFLIVDRGPAHRAKKTKAFVETLGGKLRLFFLPPYSPDRNPDELVWKHLKADTVGRMAVTVLPAALAGDQIRRSDRYARAKRICALGAGFSVAIEPQCRLSQTGSRASRTEFRRKELDLQSAH